MPRNKATGNPRHNRPTPSRATRSRAVDRKVGEEAAGIGVGMAVVVVVGLGGRVVGGVVRLGCGVCVCMIDLMRSCGKANVQKPIPPAAHSQHKHERHSVSALGKYVAAVLRW